MKYDVEITNRAYRDLEHTIDFLCLNSRTMARRWYQRIRSAFITLQQFPSRCPIAPESRNPNRTIRQLFHGKRPHVYRILFEIKGRTVWILRVVHGKQQSLGWDELDE